MPVAVQANNARHLFFFTSSSWVYS